MQLKSLTLVVVVITCILMVLRIILPWVFQLDEATRTVYYSRVPIFYTIMLPVAIGGSIKRLKEWSFGKTLLIVGACTTVGSFIMGLSIIIDL
ncbi:MAG TPA: hypothetical protein VIX80_07170 [Candidatus Kapabacteria bacterium]